MKMETSGILNNFKKLEGRSSNIGPTLSHFLDMPQMRSSFPTQTGLSLHSSPQTLPGPQATALSYVTPKALKALGYIPLPVCPQVHLGVSEKDKSLNKETTTKCPPNKTKGKCSATCQHPEPLPMPCRKPQRGGSVAFGTTIYFPPNSYFTHSVLETVLCCEVVQGRLSVLK